MGISSSINFCIKRTKGNENVLLLVSIKLTQNSLDEIEEGQVWGSCRKLSAFVE